MMRLSKMHIHCLEFMYTLESLHGAKFCPLWISNRVTGKYPFENRTKRKLLSVPVVGNSMSSIYYLSDYVMLQPHFPG